MASAGLIQPMTREDEVLKAAMTQLLLYYTRMLELLKRAGPEGAALVRDAPTVPSMMFETRKQFRV